jgi:hypothetical protein
MVQAIDNLTTLSGTVVERSPHPELQGYELLGLQIQSADAVPGRADLLGRHLGQVLTVAVPRSLLGDAGTGSRLRLRAKMTPNGAMAEPHPAPGDFSVGPQAPAHG